MTHMEQIPSHQVATAKQRQQLQQLFDRALLLKDGTRSERESASELFRQCFVTDPGNLIYAQSWLAAIGEPDAAAHCQKPIRRFFLARAAERAKAREDWQQVIHSASRGLQIDFRNVMLLTHLSQACWELEHEDVAIVLLRRAAEIDDSNDETFRRLAATLEKSGDFADARRCWSRVLALSPGDNQAKLRLDTLGEDAAAGRVQSGESNVPDSPQSIEQCLGRVDALVAGEQFAEAHRYLGHALSLFGNDIRLRERSEQLMLDQVRYEILVAEKRLEEDQSGNNQVMLSRLRVELNRREIDFYATRCQRYPDQPQLNLELGLRLKRAGIYAEAIAEFVDLVNDGLFLCRAPVEIGECWQSLRQFDRALDFYHEAAKACPETHECYKRSRYRAAVLLEAMGSPQQGRSLLEEVVRLDPDYKDAANRLDKIKKIRHDL